MSTTRPPAGVEASDAAFGILGVRVVSLIGDALTLRVRGQAGAGIHTEDSRWVFGAAEAGYAHGIGPLQGLVDADAFALRYDRPYRYDARAVRVRPGLAAGLGRFRLSVRAELLRGDWASRFLEPPAPGPLPGAGTDVRREGTLQIDGGEAVLGAQAGSLDVELGVGVRDAQNGTLDGRYTTAHLLAVLPVGRVNVFGAIRVQDAAGIDEVGGELGATTVLSGRLSVAGVLSHAVTDPVYGTRPGIGVSLGASVRLGSADGGSTGGVVVVNAPADGRRSVTLRVERPDVQSVEVAGSFNAWTPIPMTRAEDAWTLMLRLAPGTYTFAFRLADGTWFVPDDAPGIVDDGFGQRNATIVVPPL